MIAEFYIIPESFSYNSSLSNKELEERIEALAADFDQIRKYKETNRILVNPNIYDVIFIQNATICDLLYNDETARQYLNRDTRVALKNIVDKSGSTEHTFDEVAALLPRHNESICYGVIGFHEIKGIDIKDQIIYNLTNWYDFRRRFLSYYPQDGSYFIDECTKYFPNLFFHEHNSDSVTAILHNCPKKIIFHLAALNDKFRDSQLAGLNRSQVLKHFSTAADLDAEASLEGNPRRKSDLTFKFINDNKALEDVYCEPHLKLCHTDGYPGDSSYCNDRRIYFHEGKEHIQKGKILIGHIGEHL